MKIVLTESQPKKVMKEAYGGENYEDRYLNYILDKVSKSGHTSLSPEEHEDLMKISSGEKVNKPLPTDKVKKTPDPNRQPQPVGDMDAGDIPDDDGYVMNPNGQLQEMFFDAYPHPFHVSQDGENWVVTVKWTDGKLKLTNGEIVFYIIPFADNYGTIEIKSQKHSFKTDLKDIPTTQDEMNAFIEKFNGSYIRKAIDKVKNG